MAIDSSPLPFLRSMLTNPLPESKMLTVKENPTNKPDLLIIILGPTGAGMSTLANNLLGRNDMEAGESLDSITKEVQSSAVTDENSELYALAKDFDCGRTVVVDTPGFCGDRAGDYKILKLIANWLLESYKKQDVIGVLVYLHDIGKDRPTQSPVINLLHIQNLIGKYSFSNVVIGTTKHDRLQAAERVERLASLESSRWRLLAEGGATIAGVDSPASAEAILKCMRRPGFRPILLQVERVIQHEVLPANDTSRVLKRYFLERYSAMYGQNDIDDKA